MGDRLRRIEGSRRGPTPWILAAVVAIVAGILAGAAVGGREWAWAPPFAGFVVYVVALRRGLFRVRGFDVLRRPTSRNTAVNGTNLARKSSRAAEVVRADFVESSGRDRATSRRRWKVT